MAVFLSGMISKKEATSKSVIKMLACPRAIRAVALQPENKRLNIFFLVRVLVCIGVAHRIILGPTAG